MLTLSQVRPFLMHDDPFVRNAVFNYFADSWSKDETLIPDILRLSEIHGDQVNIHGLAVCRDFPVTEEALLGLLDRLGRATEGIYCLHLNAAIAKAPLDLLDKHNAAIQGNARITDETHARIKRRRQFASWSGDRLWEELERFAHQCEKHQYVSDIDLTYADALIEALAARDVPDMQTICRFLQDCDQGGGGGWLEIFVIDLAGERRVREAVPMLVDRFRVDTDYMLERAVSALAKIGDPEAVRIIQRTFPDEPWHFKNYATGVLRAIKSPESEEAVLTLLIQEQDVEIRTMLCHELCELFSERGVEIVRQQIHAGYDQMQVVLEEMLLPVIDVLGIDLPEADQWRQERQEREARIERRKRELDGFAARLNKPEPPRKPKALDSTTYRKFEAKVGRNDPCPCGSGKKYKKCCERK